MLVLWGLVIVNEEDCFGVEGDEGCLVLVYIKLSWISIYGFDIGVEEGIMFLVVERGRMYYFCCFFFV